MHCCVFRLSLSHSADKTALSGGASRCDGDKFRPTRFYQFHYVNKFVDVSFKIWYGLSENKKQLL